MNPHETLEKYAALMGWDPSTELWVALEYIDSQTDPAAFEDFVAKCAREEASLREDDAMENTA